MHPTPRGPPPRPYVPFLNLPRLDRKGRGGAPRRGEATRQSRDRLGIGGAIGPGGDGGSTASGRTTLPSDRGVRLRAERRGSDAPPPLPSLADQDGGGRGRGGQRHPRRRRSLRLDEGRRRGESCRDGECVRSRSSGDPCLGERSEGRIGPLGRREAASRHCVLTRGACGREGTSASREVDEGAPPRRARMP